MFSAIRHSRHNHERSSPARRPGQRELHLERLEDRTLLASLQGICHAIRGDNCRLPQNDAPKPNTAEVRVDPATLSSKPDGNASNSQNTAAIDHVFANESNFLGGVSVAAGDVNGDGVADVIAGAASGAAGQSPAGAPTAPISTAELPNPTAAPIIAQALFQRLAPRAPPLPPLLGGNTGVFFDPTNVSASGPAAPVLQDFPGFTGGVTVATGDLNSDGLADVVTVTGTGAGLVDDLKDQGTSSVFSSPAPANAQNGATGTGNVQIQASLTGGALRRIDDLLHDIGVLQEAKDDLGFFSDPMGGKRKSLQDQIDRKFAEIDKILHGK